jgi:hypothetical protein
MAVTAPTYVLEESLSSQKLWKYTAGQRPPQPVEERAFFEKMWAQNFTRSQVEYKMPVDVLTATTPFSLSPFADGNFDSAHIRGPEISNYNLALVPPSSENTDSNTVSKTTSHVAEATLISRLNDPTVPQQALQAEHSMPTVPRIVKGTGKDDGDLAVMIKGDNVFGTTVSKSFARPSDKGGPIVGVDTINISVASYRVVEVRNKQTTEPKSIAEPLYCEGSKPLTVNVGVLFLFVQSKKHGKYAQFLVIYREGSIRDTIGVWKRYSDFQELSKKVTQAHEGCAAVLSNMSPLAVAEEHEVEHLPNAITSWRLLKKRQRWYRCLDAGYLSLKVFLLERFLHDILFESSSPNLLRDFVGTDTSH